MPAVGQPSFFNPQSFKTNGDLGAAYRLYTYTPDTTTKKTAYTESTGSTAHTYTSDGVGGEYIALNARGELPAPMYLAAGGYDLSLKTDAGVTIWTRRAYAPDIDVAATISGSGGSASIGFVQAGVGAVTRNAQSKMREWVSPEDFGAVGDGVTNDATALQAWLDYLALTGGQGIMGAKNYLTAAALSLTNPVSGFAIRGTGAQSVIRQRTTTDVSCLSIVGAHDMLLESFKIDCGYGVTSHASHGISLRNADRCTMQNLIIYDHRNTGILTFVDAADTYGDCHIINCTSDSQEHGQNGFLHEGMMRSSIQHCTVKPLDPSGSPCYGLQLKNICRDSYIMGGFAEGCKAGIAMGGDGSTYGDGPWHCHTDGVTVKDCLDGIVLSKTTNCTVKAFCDMTDSPAPVGSTGYALNIAGFNDRAAAEIQIRGVQTGRTCVRISSDDSHVYIPYADGIGTYIARLEAGVNDASIVFGFSPQKPSNILSLIDDQSGETDNEVISIRDLPTQGLGGDPFLRFPTDDSYQNYIIYSSVNDTFGFRVAGNDRFTISGTSVRPEGDVELSLGTTGRNWTKVYGQTMALLDGVTAPATVATHAQIYVDTADGSLKVKFGSGNIKTIATDS